MNKILNEQEALELQQQGLQVKAGDAVELDDSSASSTPQGGAGRAAYHSFTASALPAAAGGVGMASGLAFGTALAPATGGASLLIPLGMGLLGAYAGAKGGEAITRAVLSPEEEAQLQKDQLEHPTASTLGGLAALPLGGMMPTPTGIARTASGLGKLGVVGVGKLAGLERAGATTAPILTAAERYALQNAAVGAGMNTVQEAVMAPLEGRDITAGSLAKQALIGATFNSPTPVIGARLGFHDYQPGRLGTPESFRQTFTPEEAATQQQEFRPTVAPIRLSPQDQIALATGQMNRTKSAQESANRMALAGDEVTPRSSEEITKRVEELQEKQTKALAKKAIPAPQQELVFELSPVIKQEIAKLPPEAYSERWKALEPQLEGLGLTPESMDVLQKEVFGPKGIALKAGEVEGGNIGKFNPLKPDEIVVDPTKAGPVIPAHEGFHEQWTKLTPEEKSRWIESSKDELATINKARVEAGRKPYDPEEYFATQGSVKFAEQGLNTKGEGTFKKWWEDTKSQFKARFGKEPTVDELLRAANLRLMNEKRGGGIPWLSTGGKDEDKLASLEENPAAERSEEQRQLYERGTQEQLRASFKKAEDKAKFDEMRRVVDEAPETRYASEDENLKAEYGRLQAFLKSKDVPFNDKMEAFKRIEEIKNAGKGKGEGMPPGKESGESVKFASSEEEINPKTGKPYSPNQARIRQQQREAFGGEIPDRTNARFGQNVHTVEEERVPFTKRTENAAEDWTPEERDAIDKTVSIAIRRQLARSGVSKLPPNIKRKDVRDFVYNDIKENGLDVDEQGVGRLGFTAWRRAAAYVQRELRNEIKTEQGTKMPIEEERVARPEVEEELPAVEEALPAKVEPTEVATREAVKQKKSVSKAEAGVSQTLSAADWYDKLSPMEGNPKIDAVLDYVSEQSPGKMISADEIAEQVGIKFASEEENIGGILTTKAEKLLRNPAANKITVNRDGVAQGNQLLASLKNQLAPAEWDMLQKAGIEREFQGRIVRPEEVRKWVQENGPKVEVHSYGMEGKVSEAEMNYSTLRHHFDGFGGRVRRLADDISDTTTANMFSENNKAIQAEYEQGKITKEQRDLLNEFNHLRQVTVEEPTKSGPRATSAYDTVSALPTNEPMPKWTATKARKNVQRVDVVLPKTTPYTTKGGIVAKNAETPTLWQPDNLHENLPNTLGWAMIQYKTGPKGEKIALIAEAQSRWGQAQREAKQEFMQKGLAAGKDKAELEKKYQDKPTFPDTPLLRDYNRLILKAAIEQARKEGATHIVVSDAETAMMTEGHDILADRPAYANRQQAENYLRDNNLEGEILHEGTRWVVKLKDPKPTQAPGMRLNYDTILPKIAEELTGSKGERVELGEHKNAMTSALPDSKYFNTREEALAYVDRISEPVQVGPYGWEVKVAHKPQPRSNLIFRNPDGTTKTDISGMMFPIESVSKRLQEGDNFTLFNKYASEEENLGPRRSFLRGMAPTFDKVEPHNPKLAEAFRSWEVSRDMYVGKGNAAIKDLSKFDEADINRVANKRREAFRSGEDYKPTGKDAEINNILKRYYHDTIGQERRDIGVTINGRKAGLNENYQPDQLSAEAIDTLVNKPDSIEGRRVKRVWIDHILANSDGSVTAKEAREYVDAYTGALGGQDNNYLAVKFGAIRKAEGYGLPSEIREKDALTALQRYSRRAASDLAMFKELESKPEIAAALGLNDARGKKVVVEGVDEISNMKEVKNAMKWVTGNFTGGTFARVNPKSAAVVRLMNNMLLGPATAIRDTASIPVNMIPYIQKFEDLGAAMRGISKVRENSRRALEVGAVQPNLDRRQFNDVLKAPDAVTEFIRKVASFARLVQGREHIENFNRELTFSIGREIAKQKIIGARAGDRKSVEWLSKFDTAVEGDLTKLRGVELEDALDVVAKNFTDRNQGTYGGRGLPVGIVDSQFAPFFALQKWSVEKANVIWQDVFEPMKTGNYLPFLTYSLGSALTGAGIQELNKILSGRKGQDPEVEEVLDKGRAQDYAAQLATLMQLGSFAGIVGDSLKAVTDPLVYGKTPRNVVSFPTATAALDMANKLSDVSEALKNGDNPFEVLKMFSLDVLTQNIQGLRMLANRTIKEDDVERADKFRDYRVFNMLEGKPNQDFTKSNRYLNLDARAFKRSSDLSEIGDMVPSLVERKVEAAGGDFDKIRSGLEGLRGNNYNIMPSLKRMPLTFMRYYQFLKDTQGEEAANARMEEFLYQQAVNKAKSGLIPRF